jgi:hypothetical protein
VPRKFFIQPPTRAIPVDDEGEGETLASFHEPSATGMATAVSPAGFHEKFTQVGIARFCNSSKASLASAGSLGGYQPKKAPSAVVQMSSARRRRCAAVKANGGSPGTDVVNVKQYEHGLEEELAHLKAELEGWSYKPRPVRRVEIPKPGGKGVRLLGIPCIQDRVVQASLKLLFDPYFSASSYGFRPGKNQRQAVEAAQRIVQSGKEHVVDIDLSKFFDRIIRLVGLTLRSGVTLIQAFVRNVGTCRPDGKGEAQVEDP